MNPRAGIACATLAVLCAGTGVAAPAPVVGVPTETVGGHLARPDQDEEPGAAQSRERAPLVARRVFELPPPTPTARRAADAAHAGRGVAPPDTRASLPSDADHGANDQPVLKPHRVGIGRNLAEHPAGVPDTQALVWTTAPDGGLVAALAVASRGAAAVRARLAIGRAPPGLEVRVYDAAGSPATVAAVPRHQLPLRRDGLVEVWTPTVPGDTVTVEVYLAPGTDRGALELSIPTLSHLDADPARPAP